MAIMTPSQARVTLRHYQDGRSTLFVDGKPLHGVMEFSFSQVVGQRDVLSVEISGSAVNIETSAFKRLDDPDRRILEATAQDDCSKPPQPND